MGKNKLQLIDCRCSYIFTIQEPINENDLAFELTQKQFKINKNRIIIRPPLEATILNFARKANINIIYESKTTPTYLGVFCKDTITLANEFEKLSNLLNQMDESILLQSSHMEVVLHGRIFINSMKSQNRLAEFGSEKIRNFSNKLKETYYLDNFKIISQNKIHKKSIHLAPYYADPRYLYFQLVLTSKNIEAVNLYIANHEKHLTDIFEVISENE